MRTASCWRYKKSEQKQRSEIKILQKRNSELSLSLHDEIKQKLRIFKQLKASNPIFGSFQANQLEVVQRSSSLPRNKTSSPSIRKSSCKLSFEGTRSPKSPTQNKNKSHLSNLVKSYFKCRAESKSPTQFQASCGIIGPAKDKKRKNNTSLALNIEEDLKNYFSGFFQSKQQFMSTNHSLNKSHCEVGRRRAREKPQGQVERRESHIRNEYHD